MALVGVRVSWTSVLGANTEPCVFALEIHVWVEGMDVWCPAGHVVVPAIGPARHLSISQKRTPLLWRDGHVKPFLSTRPRFPGELFELGVCSWSP